MARSVKNPRAFIVDGFRRNCGGDVIDCWHGWKEGVLLALKVGIPGTAWPNWFDSTLTVFDGNEANGCPPDGSPWPCAFNAPAQSWLPTAHDCNPVWPLKLNSQEGPAPFRALLTMFGARLREPSIASDDRSIFPISSKLEDIFPELDKRLWQSEHARLQNTTPVLPTQRKPRQTPAHSLEKQHSCLKNTLHFRVKQKQISATSRSGTTHKTIWARRRWCSL